MVCLQKFSIQPMPEDELLHQAESPELTSPALALSQSEYGVESFSESWIK